MVSKLALKPFKDARKMLGRMLAIGAVLSVSLSIIVGGLYSEDILRESREDLFQRANFGDAEIHLTDGRGATVNQLLELEGVQQVDPRLVLDGVVFDEGSVVSTIVVGVQEGGPTLNTYSLLEGDGLGENEVLVVGEGSGYSQGDIIDISVLGQRTNFSVSGVVDSVEFSVIPAAPGSSLPLPGNSIAVYTSIDNLEIPGGLRYNSILLEYDQNVDIDSLKEDIVQVVEGDGFQRITHQEDEFSYQLFQASIDEMHNVMPIISLIFAAIGAILIVVIVSKVVLSQQKEIGVLLAIGYSNREIIKSYLAFGAIIGAITGILGGLLGVYFGYAIVSAYSDMLIPFSISMEISALPFWLSVAMGVSLVTLAVAVPVYRISRMSPREAMRKEESEDTLLKVGKSLGPIARISARNIVRKPKRLMALMFALILTIGISGSWLIMTESILDFTDDWEENQAWDLQTTFSEPLSSPEIQGLLSVTGLNVSRAEYFYLGYGALGSQELRLLGLQQGSDLNRFILAEGSLSYGEGECLITRKTASNLCLGPGDSVTVNSGMLTKNLSVAGVVDDFREDTLFLTIEDAREISNVGDVSTGAYLDIEDDPDTAKVTMFQSELVSNAITSGDFQGTLDDLIEESIGFLYVFFLACLSVLIVTVVTVSLINVMERKSEYALLEILGFRRNASYKIIFQEIMMIGAITTVLGLPASYFIALGLRDIYSELILYFPVVVLYTTLAVIAISSIVFYAISSLSPMRAIQKSDLVEMLRSRLIE